VPPKTPAKARARQAATKSRQLRLLDKKPAFLAAFRATCSVTESANLVGIDRHAHYHWLDADPKYKLAFEASLPEAAGVLEDDMVRWARIGVFEPIIYKGKFQFAPRKRTMCKLADGTMCFEDELPAKHAKVEERKTVLTADGEMLGTFSRDAGLMAKLAVAWMPEKYGTKSVAVTGHIDITIAAADVRATLERKMADVAAAAAAACVPGETD